MFKRALVHIIICLFVVCLRPAATAATPPTIPCSIDIDGSPTIPVVVTKGMRTTTAYFTVDTGSHGCSISNRLVTLLGLNPLAELKPGETTVQPVQIPGLQFGNVYARRVRADVSDPDSPNVDGILGMEQLASLAVEFDFQQHQMRLWKPEMVASNVDWIKHKATFQLPLTEPEPNRYTLPITVNNTSVRQAIIDTGSDGIVLTQRQSEELHLKPVGKRPGTRSASRGDRRYRRRFTRPAHRSDKEPGG